MSGPEQPFSDDLVSLFDDMFSGELRRPDVHATLQLTELEAETGVTREIEIQRMVACTACEGRGGATPTDVTQKCAACNGAGGTEQRQGFLLVKATCPACRGAGSTNPNPCVPCAGRGVVRTPAMVEVTVPPGQAHGTTVRVLEQGNLAPDGTRGALLVYLVVGDRSDTRADDARAAFERMLIEPNVPRAIVRRPGGFPVLTPPLLLGLAIIAALVLLGVVR